MTTFYPFNHFRSRYRISLSSIGSPIFALDPLLLITSPTNGGGNFISSISILIQFEFALLSVFKTTFCAAKQTQLFRVRNLILLWKVSARVFFLFSRFFDSGRRKMRFLFICHDLENRWNTFKARRDQTAVFVFDENRINSAEFSHYRALMASASRYDANCSKAKR